ncbi:dienelactone hydrolase family protein [Alteromonas facilis]|uniref:dienelactone hydrolase family protein n=1 Tax=Alteromonas facilis TaxID=2048004 RepID=UPI000C292A43|nr:dienelactone hydrolase family protein [Alteromonas facilis]
MTEQTNKQVLKADNIPQEAFDWYDDYAHGDMSRRRFVQLLATLPVAGITLGTITSALTPNYALAEQVSFNHPGIRARYETFESPSSHKQGKGYWVAPKDVTEPLPAVLVVHENRGLNPYIKDVARRLALHGYVAFAPDALHPLGGYPGNDDEGRAMQRSLERSDIEMDFMAAADWLKASSKTTSKVGVVGFCFGGYISNLLAATKADVISAAVPYYGTPASPELQARVKGPLLLHFAEMDKRVNATWPDYQAILDKHDVPYDAHVYAGAQHGFHNDSTSRYSANDAELSWQRTLAFFDSQLKS